MNEVMGAAAWHEAGHAVMRRLCGLPATRLIVRAEGSGLCEGTGRRIRVDDAVRIALAGPVAEAGILFADQIDWQRSRFDDFDRARALLAQTHPSPDDIQRALRAEFSWVAELLRPQVVVVEEIAERLMGAKILPPPTVAALCRRVQM